MLSEVLIVSDSHGWEEEVQLIKDRYPNVDARIHCGDSELPYDAKELDGFYRVQGNCDMDSRYKEEIDFKLGKLHFYSTHGHLFQIKSSLMHVSYRAEELGANIICHGHSHIAAAERIGDQIVINPGSIRQPRGAHPGSYALLNFDESTNLLSIRYFTLEGKEISSLYFETKLD